MESLQPHIQFLIRMAGLAQVVLVCGSLAIPRVLNWKPELAKVQLLIKQMFWTYAAYILVINLCFGLISLFGFRELTSGTNLAMLLTGFIAAYWLSRVLVQFFYFDRANFPKGRWNTAAEILLVALFICLAIIYSLAAYLNFNQH